MKIYAFDLDNTLCYTEKNRYIESVPIIDRINIVNDLYDAGNKIIIYTARGCVSGLTLNLVELTKNQLSIWGVKYTELSMGVKINYDILIDDKAECADTWFDKQNKTKQVGFIASSFDLVHPGYVRLLKDCKTVCNYLVCAIHIDPKSERNIKNSPVHTIEERIEIMSSIKYVDEIVTYNTEKDLEELLKTIKPDVRILGTDYKNRQFTGDYLSIPVHWHERKHGYSSTNLRKKIKNAN